MREHRIALSLVAFVTLGAAAAFFLVPKGELNQESRLAAIPAKEALALLNAAQEPLPPRLAFQRAELTAQAGNALLADTLLAELAARTEQTAIISQARADLAIRRGDLRKAADYLSAAHDRAPSLEGRQKLAGLYRQLGDRVGERRTLASSPLTELTGSELVRLVDLIAADATPAEALEIARAAVPLAGQSASALAERFAAIALSTGQSNLLVQAASTWLSEAETQTVAESLAKVLTLRPRTAKSFAEAVVFEAPQTRVLLIEAFTKVRLFDVARTLLQSWTNVALMTDTRWGAIILYADRSGDIRPLERLLQQMPPQQNPPDRAFLPLIRYDGETALLPYQHWLTPEYLESAPLTEAAWALARQRTDEAFTALHRAAQTEHDPALWQSLANKLQDRSYYNRLQALSADALE
ncbi:hypothetical protein HKX17_16840 [Sulfitobacter sp. KE34]|nr:MULTISPECIES: hypothetical protein [unclassified Sulfitobacter]MDF3377454.1 hypothetical protein [Sulfitobacter sp. KE37]MDF3438602.1 hypothetical protein [Sulfitobacter sp. Ks46]MDF3355487.1 hypothetical protein [Sulfitobacter sp. KE27]MDF3359135.1 hypothetical protein [Sulfitobacter sp. KE33]MDF3366559.1 hypothetical protein [Sulfitobacter sp. Ks34]